MFIKIIEAKISNTKDINYGKNSELFKIQKFVLNKYKFINKARASDNF